MALGQDLPPPGGFQAIVYKRRTPVRGPPGWSLFLGGAAIISGGLYLVTMANRETHKLQVEKQWIKIYLAPLLQAEEDRRYLAWKAEKDAEEAVIMKDVKGWKVGEATIHSKKRFYPPANFQ